MKDIYLAEVDRKYAKGIVIDKSKGIEYPLRENDSLKQELFPRSKKDLEDKALEFEEFFKYQK